MLGERIDRGLVADPAAVYRLLRDATPLLHVTLGTQRVNQLKVSTASKKMRTVSEEAMGAILPPADIPQGGGGGDDSGAGEEGAAAAGQ